MFNHSFFRFFFGFMVLIALGIAGAVVAQSYADQEGTVFELIASFLK